MVLQQEVYKKALINQIISLDEVKLIVKNEQTARTILYRLSRKGLLLKVKAGLYAAIPLEESGESWFEVNRHLVADRLSGPNGAIAFHTALEVHGVAYSAFNRVFYLTDRRQTRLDFQDIDYRPVWMVNIFGVENIYIDGVSALVTDKERTFLDCLRRLDLCGGLEEYLKSVDGFVLMSAPKLLDYLERFGEQSLYQRAGFVLSYLKDTIRVEKDLLTALREKVGKTPYYLVPHRYHAEGRLVKEWNVYVPRNFEEIVRFV